MSVPRRIVLHSASQNLFEPRIKLFDAATSGTSEVILNGNARRWIVTLQYDGVCAAGEVLFESAGDKDFAGTWTEESNSSAAPGDKTDRIVSDSAATIVRLRIETPITGGGTLTAWLEAEGPY